MKLEIKKSEVAVLKQALREYSWMLHKNIWVDADKSVWKDTKSLSYRISLLKKLAMIERRLIGKLLEKGWQKRKQSHCWWMWSTLDEFWYKTRGVLTPKQRKEYERNRERIANDTEN